MKNKNEDREIHAKLRREEMPVRAGRGAGYHKSKKAYTRKPKHKGRYDA